MEFLVAVSVTLLMSASVTVLMDAHKYLKRRCEEQRGDIMYGCGEARFVNGRDRLQWAGQLREVIQHLAQNIVRCGSFVIRVRFTSFPSRVNGAA
jgi:hypothetical protein